MKVSKNKSDSIAAYKTLLDSTITLAKNTNISKEEKKEFWDRVNSAHRIYVTGVGTSLATAQLLATLLRERVNSPVQFLSIGSMIRKSSSIDKGELIIMISHGLNRADSLIISSRIKNKGDLIVITGNKEADLPNKALKIVVGPEKEKIFCRPVSPITTFIAITQLFDIDSREWLDELNEVSTHKNLVDFINPDTQTIIVYTAGVEHAAQMWGIVLREGAGLNAMAKDIEGYAHGFYGVDTKDLANRQYIILTNSSPEDKLDYTRSAELYNIEGLKKFKFQAKSKDSIKSNLELFIQGFKAIYGIIDKSGFDMNNPNGKEENRRYHEYGQNEEDYRRG